MVEGLSFRLVAPEDKELLYTLYACSRETEMAMLAWTEAEKRAFLRMQCDLQHNYYSEVYPDAQYLIVRLNGEDMGRLYVLRDPNEKLMRIMDITLMPHHRGRGIGTALIKDLLNEAYERGMPLGLFVEPYNPALHLYERLGFRKIHQEGAYFYMERKPLPNKEHEGAAASLPDASAC